MKRSFLSDNECQKTSNFEGLEPLALVIRSPRNLWSCTSFEGLELHFEVNQSISKVQQTFNFEGGLYSKFRKPVFLTSVLKVNLQILIFFWLFI
ncbi:hypothetical protein RclHR1_33090001 [Rhizophagus clarus]|uniref:Uncharacterized protein n=1 Tax=Rhizophagus clarus TaxID=94130 RepID=A0A2Z6S3V4_9GLOM|nr:hypothetical protein RclHR1_33090001 [Rhizophagus clarus]